PAVSFWPFVPAAALPARRAVGPLHLARLPATTPQEADLVVAGRQHVDLAVAGEKRQEWLDVEPPANADQFVEGDREPVGPGSVPSHEHRQALFLMLPEVVVVDQARDLLQGRF